MINNIKQNYNETSRSHKRQSNDNLTVIMRNVNRA